MKTGKLRHLVFPIINGSTDLIKKKEKSKCILPSWKSFKGAATDAVRWIGYNMELEMWRPGFILFSLKTYMPPFWQHGELPYWHSDLQPISVSALFTQTSRSSPGHPTLLSFTSLSKWEPLHRDVVDWIWDLLRYNNHMVCHWTLNIRRWLLLNQTIIRT